MTFAAKFFGPLAAGSVLLYAGFSKIIDRSFAHESFELFLPSSAALVAAIAFSILETALGLMVLLGIAPRFSRIFAACLLATILGGSIAIGNIAHDVPCGCFGAAADHGWSPSPEARVLLLIALILFLSHSAASSSANRPITTDNLTLSSEGAQT